MGEIFSAIRQPDDARLMVGFQTSDDGAVFRLDDQTALVQTVDFFTPIVDDPETFGAIAAANSLSDIYAMGGSPLTALSMVCFPYTSMAGEILTAIVRGGAAKIAESGALVVGGHSVSDEEIKFGYAITGTVHPDQIWRNHTARPGDALILTKPLGTGTLTTAVKQDKLAPSFLEEPIAEMLRLNRAAAEAARAYEIHAATDVTGFGLMGHLFEMIKPLGLGAVVDCGSLACFPGAWEAVQAKALTRAHRTNREYVTAVVETAALAHYGDLLFDPQTSGGLLLALPADQAESLLADLRASGHRPSLVGHFDRSGAIHCK